MPERPSHNAVPAWQTEELQEEWVDLEPEDDTDDDDGEYGTRSISFTTPLATHIHTNSAQEDDRLSQQDGSGPVGTFHIREDVQHAPLLPKTPGGPKKGMIKDFFTPLQLERMFEPPSPPGPSRSAATESVPDHMHPTSSPSPEDDHNLGVQDPACSNPPRSAASKHDLSTRFTFAVPRQPHLAPSLRTPGLFPQAQSTPNPPFLAPGPPPATDPRLRLFQLQYDTYTRDHLSAIVDSIAVNSPSGTGTTNSPSYGQGLSRQSNINGHSHLRSAKRVKLSPRSDLCGNDAASGAVIARPRINIRDYVGESRSLMQQIKQARDFSTISSAVSAHQSPEHPSSSADPEKSPQALDPPREAPRGPSPSFLAVQEQDSGPSSTPGTVSSRGTASTSSTYREQAMALMAQIRSDMKGQKRLFSGDTEQSCVTARTEDKGRSIIASPPTAAIQITPADDDEPQPRIRHRHTSSTSSASNRSRARPSPRKSPRRGSPKKVFRQMSVSEQAERKLAEEMSNLSLQRRAAEGAARASTSSSDSSSLLSSALHHRETSSGHLAPPPANLAPPSYPSSSLRAKTSEDLNRFVSSSTASGTTLTAGSAPSFVKHAGPAQIRTIAPGDIPALPDRLGDMVYDKVLMKWVKNTAQSTREDDDGGDASEDPFGDIESLRDDSKGRDTDSTPDPHERDDMSETREGGDMTRIEEQSEVDDEEELELMSFSTDDPSRLGDVIVGSDANPIDDGDQTTDSEDEHDYQRAVADNQVHYDSDEQTESEFQPDPPSPPSRLVVAHVPATPMGQGGSLPSSATTPIIRSALKSHSATPSSVLKDPKRSKYQTPLQKPGHRRSVSFSDGKLEGPIRGLSTACSTTDGESDGAHSALGESSAMGSTGGFFPSARSKRIADMMDALVDTDSDGNESPSKSKGSSPDEIQPLSSRSSNESGSANLPSNLKGSTSSRRIFSKSHKSPQNEGARSKHDATFLTECSFGVAHDRLVEVITDVQPFEPHWDTLTSIDLSKKKLESVARLKEFLPQLDGLNLNSNQLSWLTGVPGTVRTLSVASNNLTGIASYGHLLNLENLDISHNDVDSLRQLSCLRHLRELKADGNNIASLDGLQHMDGLVKLSLQGNSIPSMELNECRWTRLEMLNMSHNRLEGIYGLASLQSLIALNLDNNALGELDIGGSMSRLRILRVSGNRLQQLRLGSMPNLRTLYADNNALATLVKLDRLTKLENLSLRNQSGRGLHLLTRDIRDVKRLYLSGNPLKTRFLEEPCYNLIYLELAACRLTALPEELATLVPNLRVLNLNYNFLEDARPLEGLTRLRKLTVIGSRLKGTKPLIRLIQRMPEVEMLDFRMNPCTLGWYLPLLVKDVPGALQPSERGEKCSKGERAGLAWQDLDCKFRRDLPDESYIGRLAYRGLIMRACSRIRMLDGVEVTEKEKAKAHHLLVGILGKGKKAKRVDGVS
ncbi:hypothetical protein BDN72DRAFT_795336 [Pluteus cervinus]|uniref:Uncharacterized protein n=1 Tax=Pluteus cervinus TaxID=181527 RepID=A0ACD3AXQ4_9AGAR|nr:hypothetical protein BDN72DRAFT_795336 [Pluteus cervinus]